MKSVGAQTAMGKQKVGLTVIEARDVWAVDFNGRSDPYAKWYWNGKKYKTEVRRATLNPRWDKYEELELDSRKSPILKIEIWDLNDLLPNVCIGNVSIDLSLLKPGVSDAWYPITYMNQRGKGACHIRLELFGGSQHPTYPYPTPAYPAPVPTPAYPPHNYPAPAPYNSTPAYPASAPYNSTPAYPASAPYVSATKVSSSRPHKQSSSSSSSSDSRKRKPEPKKGREPMGPADIRKKNVKNFWEIKWLLPQEPDEKIHAALNKFDNDKDAALNYLLNEQFSIIASQRPPDAIPAQSVAAVSSRPPPDERRNSFTDLLEAIPGPSSSSSKPTDAPPPTAAEPETAHPAPHVLQSPQDVSRAYGARRALLIGVNYRGQRRELAGPNSDVHRMRDFLIQVMGFPGSLDCMLCLTEDNPDWRYHPTKHNIMSAMCWLTTNRRPGDCLFFLFSGHGGQVADYSGVETDGANEVIYPLDHKTAGNITDDELHAYLVRPLPAGVRMTAVFDACHSGTGLDLPFVWDSRKQNWREERNPYFVPSDVQLFSACCDRGVAVDDVRGGMMTMAFISAIIQNPYQQAYPMLLENIKKALGSAGYVQTPQLSSTQRFDWFYRPFSLYDIVPNQNPSLGQMKKNNRRSSRGQVIRVVL